MISRRDLQDYLHELLVCDDFKDYCPNGLQVQGKTPIQSICTAVSASKEIILSAAEKNADALLVHHGFFWKGEAAEIIDIKYGRIKALIDSDMSLFAYHLPLDCHPELGNNRQIANLLPLDSSQSHQAAGIKNLLWSGILNRSYQSQEFQQLLSEKFQRQALKLGNSSRPIQTIAWCSGAAEDLITQAALLGADAYISGEVSERTYYQAQELDLHYFSCGHHATERYGIKALGEQLAARFDLKHDFLDSENPV